MKRRKRILALVALAGGLIFQARAEAQFAMPNSVLGNGGAVVSNSAYRVIGTLGQPAIGASHNSSNRNATGFWLRSSAGLAAVSQNNVLTKTAESAMIPTEFNLAQNHPNPFNPATTISYALPVSQQVTLKVYDMLGHEVATLVQERQAAGNYIINFDAGKLSTGVYFYRLQAGSFVETRKMLLVR